MTPCRQSEDEVVDIIIAHLKSKGFVVAKEVANFYRSADIAAISPSGEVWIVEGKLASMKHAVKQLEVHKQSAERVFIGTPFRKLKQKTKKMLDKEAIGLIFTNESSVVEISVCTKTHIPWGPSRKALMSRIRSNHVTSQ